MDPCLHYVKPNQTQLSWHLYQYLISLFIFKKLNWIWSYIMTVWSGRSWMFPLLDIHLDFSAWSTFLTCNNQGVTIQAACCITESRYLCCQFIDHCDNQYTSLAPICNPIYVLIFLFNTKLKAFILFLKVMFVFFSLPEQKSSGHYNIRIGFTCFNDYFYSYQSLRNLSYINTSVVYHVVSVSCSSKWGQPYDYYSRKIYSPKFKTETNMSFQ